MPQVRTGYTLEFQEIAPGNPVLGEAAVIPWDTEIFQFRVAAYRPAAPQLEPNVARDMPLSFRSCMEANEIALCSCVIPATDSFWRIQLPAAGFSFVDFALQVSLNGLSVARIPEPRFTLRPAMPEDRPTIESIAAHSFEHGRYHADPLVPKEAADRRYLRWMQNALSGGNAADRVFVLGEPGNVMGFYHVTLEGQMSDLRLAAVAPEHRTSMVGFDLYASVLHQLRSLGIRRVVSTISPANTAVMNVYSMLGFRFGNPELIYHWHSARDSQ